MDKLSIRTNIGRTLKFITAGDIFIVGLYERDSVIWKKEYDNKKDAVLFFCKQALTLKLEEV